MHEDFFRAPLDLNTTEDTADAVAVQVAEPSFSGVAVIPESSKRKADAKIGNEEEGEESAPVEVAFTEKNLIGHRKPLPPVKIEELPALADKLGDSKPVQAFKIAFREVISMRFNSKVRAVTYGTNDGPVDKPSCKATPVDFFADVLLAGRRVLSVANYRLLCQQSEECFAFWDKVPARVRKFIEQTVGQSLIDRRIVLRNSTRHYFRDDYFLRRCAKAA